MGGGGAWIVGGVDCGGGENCWGEAQIVTGQAARSPVLRFNVCVREGGACSLYSISCDA